MYESRFCRSSGRERVHLLLTDRLACPRCGPAFGLILLAHRLEERVVLEGVLGCPNCRDSFPISGGFGDLRAPPRGDLASGLAGPPADVSNEASRLMALLGIVGGPGTVALVGEPARAAGAVAAALGDVQVVAIDPDLRLWPEQGGVSRLVSAPGLPFFTGILRGVVLDGRLGPAWLTEAARVLAPRARLVIVHPSSDTEEHAAKEGLVVVAADAQTIVAARS
jgi:uncharacterized protein YbaR (Trm112 family)